MNESGILLKTGNKSNHHGSTAATLLNHKLFSVLLGMKGPVYDHTEQQLAHSNGWTKAVCPCKPESVRHRGSCSCIATITTLSCYQPLPFRKKEMAALAAWRNNEVAQVPTNAQAPLVNLTAPRPQWPQSALTNQRQGAHFSLFLH